MTDMTLSPTRRRSATMNPVAGFIDWLLRAKAVRTRRMTLAALLAFDDARLGDLGVTRQDLIDATYHRGAPAPLQGD